MRIIVAPAGDIGAHQCARAVIIKRDDRHILHQYRFGFAHQGHTRRGVGLCLCRVKRRIIDGISIAGIILHPGVAAVIQEAENSTAALRPGIAGCIKGSLTAQSPEIPPLG